MCKTWQQASDNHHRLWKVIDVYGSADALCWLMLCLTNSGSVDLEVYFHAPHHMEAACGLLLPHSDRVRLIATHGYDALEKLENLQPLFDRTLPRLEELNVLGTWYFPGDLRFVLTELLDMHPARLPALRVLRLDGVFLPWTSPLLPQLRVLDCHGWSVDLDTGDEELDVPLPAFLTTLAACHSLEHLSLFLNSAKPHILDEDASHAQGAGPIPTIALPHLRVAEIALCEDDADIFLSVLSHVRFSARCRIALRCGTRAPERGRAALLFPNDPELYPILRTAVQATWHGAHGFSCIGPGPDPGPGEADERGELVVDVDCSREWFNKHTTDPYPMLGEFCEYLRQAPLKKLRIEWRVYRSAYVQVLRTFPALEELAVDVMFDPTGVRDLFRVLAEGAASTIVMDERETDAGQSSLECQPPAESPGTIAHPCCIRGSIRREGGGRLHQGVSSRIGGDWLHQG